MRIGGRRVLSVAAPVEKGVGPDVKDLFLSANSSAVLVRISPRYLALMASRCAIRSMLAWFWA